MAGVSTDFIVDISDSETKKCFKIAHRLLDNLMIFYNANNSMLILWNKYQIFVYNDYKFDSEPTALFPNLTIRNVILSSKYLVYLDFGGNLHKHSMKFKHSPKKRIKSDHLPEETGFIMLKDYYQDKILSVKFENGTYHLCFHIVSVKLLLIKQLKLLDSEGQALPNIDPEKCLLIYKRLSLEDYEHVKQMFNTENEYQDHDIILITLDKRTVYCCLYSPELIEDTIKLIKLYKCPMDICNFTISDDLNIIIGITSGTVIKLSLRHNVQTPDIVHLNTSLTKLIFLKDIIIYTDGSTMWNTKYTFDPINIKFNQYFVRNVKDIQTCGDQIICTTYNNLIYILPMFDNDSLLMATFSDEYCPAEKLTRNSEYFYNIISKVEKCDELKKKILKEGNYLSTLALCNRQDIMDSVIHTQIFVYESYQDVINHCTNLYFSNDMNEYFGAEDVFFLVKLFTTEVPVMFHQILSKLIGVIKIHITLVNKNKTIKTMSVKVKDILTNTNILVPLRVEKSISLTEINVFIEIVTYVPGVHDENQCMWAMLYRKCISLKSEHFLKVPGKDTSREPVESIDDLIYKVGCNEYGHMFHLTSNTEHGAKQNEWSLYIKLPVTYQETFANEDFTKYFNPLKAEFLRQQLNSDVFLTSRNTLSFQIENVKINIAIVNDISNKLLQITSENMKHAFNLKMFFSKLLYCNLNECEPSKGLLPINYNTLLDDFKTKLQSVMDEGAPEDKFLPLVKYYEKYIISCLPYFQHPITADTRSTK